MAYFEAMILCSFMVLSALSASVYSLIFLKGFIRLGRKLIVSSTTFFDFGNLVFIKNIRRLKKFIGDFRAKIDAGIACNVCEKVAGKVTAKVL